MKNESERIADQLKRAFDGEAWHGPSLKEAIDGVTVSEAVARPIAGAHSIWELVTHITGWEGVVSRRLNGEAVSEPAEGDFPAPPTEVSDDSWSNLQTQVFERHEQLVAQMAALTETDLRRRIDEKPYPAWFMAHGAVGHALYHVGQIVLLKKMLKGNPQPADQAKA
jgi:uncharacterized damage-inducible protein DinB